MEAEKEIEGLRLQCEVVETVKPEVRKLNNDSSLPSICVDAFSWQLAYLDLEERNRKLIQENERHQVNEASAIRKLEAHYM